MFIFNHISVNISVLYLFNFEKYSVKIWLLVQLEFVAIVHSNQLICNGNILIEKESYGAIVMIKGGMNICDITEPVHCSKSLQDGYENVFKKLVRKVRDIFV